MRQLIRRRGDAKGGSYIDQAGREIEAASAKRAREGHAPALRPCIRCANLVPMQPGLPGYQQTLCDPCAAEMGRAAEEEMRNGRDDAGGNHPQANASREAACPMCGSTRPHLTTDCERELEAPVDG